MQPTFELTPKQAEYIRNAHHRWNVACGAVRSGKSYCQISYCIPSRLVERHGLRGLRVILGATRANIERNVLQPLRDIYGEGVATSINSQNHCRILGEKVYCFGADNIRQVAKIRGSEIAYCAVDEATDVNEEVFEMLKSRLSLPWSCCDITTNPASPNHWFKSFLDSRKQGVDIYLQNYTIYDNPFLPKEYVRNLEAEYAGTVFFDRYILGEWALAEGLIYPNYEKAITKTLPERFDDYIISLDYGTSNPFAAILWGYNSKTWYGFKEIYYSGRDTGTQKTDDQYLKMLEKMIEPIKASRISTGRDFLGQYREVIDKIKVIVDPSAASFITLLRQSEWFLPIPADNSVLDGIRNTFTAIERGLIKLHESLDDWKDEVRGYVWDADADEDRPVKEDDHLMDAKRYFVQTMGLVKRDVFDEYISPFQGGRL